MSSLGLSREALRSAPTKIPLRQPQINPKEPKTMFKTAMVVNVPGRVRSIGNSKTIGTGKEKITEMGKTDKQMLISLAIPPSGRYGPENNHAGGPYARSYKIPWFSLDPGPDPSWALAKPHGPGPSLSRLCRGAVAEAAGSGIGDLRICRT